MANIMVADDAPFIREIVRSIAERAGHVIVGEAIDGQHAVELALATRPDVILMDIVMPRKSGIEAAAEIMKAIPGSRIVAFTTASEDVLAGRALEAGCRSFLPKPFGTEELLAAINGCLEGA